MQVRRVRGTVLSMVLGLAVLPSFVPDGPGLRSSAVDAVPPVAGRLMLVRHVGIDPVVVVDTTALAGPALRGWWADGVTGETVDAGSVLRGAAVVLHPPDTGEAAVRDWTIVIVDATRGLVPPA